MMYELKIWNYDDAEVRTVEINGEPWFVGKDIAIVLGYSNPRKALLDHVDEEDKMDGVTIRDSIGRPQNPVLINESGMYSIILSSKLPTAKAFKRWITSEVLPAIRKTGGYAIDTTFTPELQALIKHERMMQEQQRQLNVVQNKVDAIQESFLLQPSEDWKKGVRIAVGKISEQTCGNFSMMQELYRQAYDLLEYRAGADLEVRVRNKRNRLEQNGATKTAIKKVTYLEIIDEDKRLREIFTAILREMSAKVL